jgi:hypothetical protein
MVFGSFVVAFCLIILGWTAEIVAMFVKEPEKVGTTYNYLEYESTKLMRELYRPKMSLSRWLYLVYTRWIFPSTLVSGNS